MAFLDKIHQPRKNTSLVSPVMLKKTGNGYTVQRGATNAQSTSKGSSARYSWDGKSYSELSLPEFVAYARKNVTDDKVWSAISSDVSSPGSRFYNPYQGGKTTQTAAQQFFAENYGYNGAFDDNFEQQFMSLRNYEKRSATTGSLLTPGKKDSKDVWAAYYYNQILMDKEVQADVDNEWAKLRQDAASWYKNRISVYGKAPSASEFIEHLDVTNNYKTLAKLDASRNIGTLDSQKVLQLNRGTYYSSESLYGLYYALTNGEDLSADRDYFEDSVQYFLQPLPSDAETLGWTGVNLNDYTPEELADAAFGYSVDGNKTSLAELNYARWLNSGSLADPDPLYEINKTYGWLHDDAWFERVGAVLDPYVALLKNYKGEVEKPDSKADEAYQLAYAYHQESKLREVTDKLESEWSQYKNLIADVVSDELANNPDASLEDLRLAVDFAYKYNAYDFDTLEKYLKNPDSVDLCRQQWISNDQIDAVIETAASGKDVSVDRDYAAYNSPANKPSYIAATPEDPITVVQQTEPVTYLYGEGDDGARRVVDPAVSALARETIQERASRKAAAAKANAEAVLNLSRSGGGISIRDIENSDLSVYPDWFAPETKNTLARLWNWFQQGYYASSLGDEYTDEAASAIDPVYSALGGGAADVPPSVGETLDAYVDVALSNILEDGVNSVASGVVMNCLPFADSLLDFAHKSIDEASVRELPFDSGEYCAALADAEGVNEDDAARYAFVRASVYSPLRENFTAEYADSPTLSQGTESTWNAMMSYEAVSHVVSAFGGYDEYLSLRAAVEDKEAFDSLTLTLLASSASLGTAVYIETDLALLRDIQNGTISASDIIDAFRGDVPDESNGADVLRDAEAAEDNAAALEERTAPVRYGDHKFSSVGGSFDILSEVEKLNSANAETAVPISENWFEERIRLDDSHSWGELATTFGYAPNDLEEYMVAMQGNSVYFTEEEYAAMYRAIAKGTATYDDISGLMLERMSEYAPFGGYGITIANANANAERIAAFNEKALADIDEMIANGVEGYTDAQLREYKKAYSVFAELGNTAYYVAKTLTPDVLREATGIELGDEYETLSGWLDDLNPGWDEPYTENVGAGLIDSLVQGVSGGFDALFRAPASLVRLLNNVHGRSNPAEYTVMSSDASAVDAKYIRNNYMYSEARDALRTNVMTSFESFGSAVTEDTVRNLLNAAVGRVIALPASSAVISAQDALADATNLIAAEKILGRSWFTGNVFTDEMNRNLEEGYDLTKSLMKSTLNATFEIVCETPVEKIGNLGAFQKFALGAQKQLGKLPGNTSAVLWNIGKNVASELGEEELNGLMSYALDVFYGDSTFALGDLTAELGSTAANTVASTLMLNLLGLPSSFRSYRKVHDSIASGYLSAEDLREAVETAEVEIIEADDDIYRPEDDAEREWRPRKRRTTVSSEADDDIYRAETDGEGVNEETSGESLPESEIDSAGRDFAEGDPEKVDKAVERIVQSVIDGHAEEEAEDDEVEDNSFDEGADGERDVPFSEESSMSEEELAASEVEAVEAESEDEIFASIEPNKRIRRRAKKAAASLDEAVLGSAAKAQAVFMVEQDPGVQAQSKAVEAAQERLEEAESEVAELEEEVRKRDAEKESMFRAAVDEGIDPSSPVVANGLAQKEQQKAHDTANLNRAQSKRAELAKQVKQELKKLDEIRVRAANNYEENAYTVGKEEIERRRATEAERKKNIQVSREKSYVESSGGDALEEYVSPVGVSDRLTEADYTEREGHYSEDRDAWKGQPFNGYNLAVQPEMTAQEYMSRRKESYMAVPKALYDELRKAQKAGPDGAYADESLFIVRYARTDKKNNAAYDVQEPDTRPVSFETAGLEVLSPYLTGKYSVYNQNGRYVILCDDRMAYVPNPYSDQGAEIQQRISELEEGVGQQPSLGKQTRYAEESKLKLSRIAEWVYERLGHAPAYSFDVDFALAERELRECIAAARKENWHAFPEVSVEVGDLVRVIRKADRMKSEYNELMKRRGSEGQRLRVLDRETLRKSLDGVNLSHGILYSFADQFFGAESRSLFEHTDSRGGHYARSIELMRAKDGGIAEAAKWLSEHHGDDYVASFSTETELLSEWYSEALAEEATNFVEDILDGATVDRLHDVNAFKWMARNGGIIAESDRNNPDLTSGDDPFVVRDRKTPEYYVRTDEFMRLVCDENNPHKGSLKEQVQRAIDLGYDTSGSALRYKSESELADASANDYVKYRAEYNESHDDKLEMPTQDELDSLKDSFLFRRSKNMSAAVASDGRSFLTVTKTNWDSPLYNNELVDPSTGEYSMSRAFAVAEETLNAIRTLPDKYRRPDLHPDKRYKSIVCFKAFKDPATGEVKRVGYCVGDEYVAPAAKKASDRATDFSSAQNEFTSFDVPKGVSLADLLSEPWGFDEIRVRNVESAKYGGKTHTQWFSICSRMGDFSSISKRENDFERSDAFSFGEKELRDHLEACVKRYLHSGDTGWMTSAGKTCLEKDLLMAYKDMLLGERYRLLRSASTELESMPRELNRAYFDRSYGLIEAIDARLSEISSSLTSNQQFYEDADNMAPVDIVSAARFRYNLSLDTVMPAASRPNDPASKAVINKERSKLARAREEAFDVAGYLRAKSQTSLVKYPVLSAYLERFPSFFLDQDSAEEDAFLREMGGHGLSEAEDYLAVSEKDFSDLEKTPTANDKNVIGYVPDAERKAIVAATGKQVARIRRLVERMRSLGIDENTESKVGKRLEDERVRNAALAESAENQAAYLQAEEDYLDLAAAVGGYTSFIDVENARGKLSELRSALIPEEQVSALERILDARESELAAESMSDPFLKASHLLLAIHRDPNPFDKGEIRRRRKAYGDSLKSIAGNPAIDAPSVLIRLADECNRYGLYDIGEFTIYHADVAANGSDAANMSMNLQAHASSGINLNLFTDDGAAPVQSDDRYIRAFIQRLSAGENAPAHADALAGESAEKLRAPARHLMEIESRISEAKSNLAAAEREMKAASEAGDAKAESEARFKKAEAIRQRDAEKERRAEVMKGLFSGNDVSERLFRETSYFYGDGYKALEKQTGKDAAATTRRDSAEAHLKYGSVTFGKIKSAFSEMLDTGTATMLTHESLSALLGSVVTEQELKSNLTLASALHSACKQLERDINVLDLAVKVADGLLDGTCTAAWTSGKPEDGYDQFEITLNSDAKEALAVLAEAHRNDPEHDKDANDILRDVVKKIEHHSAGGETVGKAYSNDLKNELAAKRKMLSVGKQNYASMYRIGSNGINDALFGTRSARLPAQIVDISMAAALDGVGNRRNPLHTLSRNFSNPRRVNRTFFGKNAPLINALYFDGVFEANGKIQREIAGYSQKLKQLGLNQSNSEFVQRYGERVMSLSELRKERPKDWEKIEEIADYMKAMYRDLLLRVNGARGDLGLDPILVRQNYFPHISEEGNFLLSMFGAGHKDSNALATAIIGRTEDTHAIKGFNPHELHREKQYADSYDAVAGFNSYIGFAMREIYMAPCTIRLRQYEGALRGVMDMTENGRRAKGQLSNYTMWVSDYTDMLEGKKGSWARAVEKDFGRGVYNALMKYRNLRGAALTAYNLRSVAANVIPLLDAAAVNPVSTVTSMTKLITNRGYRDHILAGSSFMQSRGKSMQLTENHWQDFLRWGYYPAALADGAISAVVVGSRYDYEIKRGYSDAEAMRRADAFAADLMASRNPGESGTAYADSLKATIFQFTREAVNEIAFIANDLRQYSSGGGTPPYWLSLMLLAVFGAFFNDITGLSTAVDPINAVGKTVKQHGEDDDAVDFVRDFGSNMLETINPLYNLTSGGATRIPAVSGIMEVGDLLAAAINDDKEDLTWEMFAETVAKQLPGGMQGWRTYEGTRDLIRGYSTTDAGNIRFLVDSNDLWSVLKAPTLGVTSTKGYGEYELSGYDALSAKQTAEILDRVERGMDITEAYEEVKGEIELNRLRKKASEASDSPEATSIRQSIQMPSGVADWAKSSPEAEYVQSGVDLWKQTGNEGVLPKGIDLPTEKLADGRVIHYASVGGNEYPLTDEDVAALEAEYQRMYKSVLKRADELYGGNAEAVADQLSKNRTLIIQNYIKEKVR